MKHDGDLQRVVDIAMERLLRARPGLPEQLEWLVDGQRRMLLGRHGHL